MLTAGATRPGLRVPPAWTEVLVDDSEGATLWATGTDAAGRKCRLYDPAFLAANARGKFARVAALMVEADQIRHQVEADLNDLPAGSKRHEAALCAYLLLETGMRPGSTADTRAKVQAFGATTLQLRHVKACPRGVRLQFVGKKGVAQNVLVTNPYLVGKLLRRKRATTSYTTPVFATNSGAVQGYVRRLGTGGYKPKDLRTLKANLMAERLLASRTRLPKSLAARKRLGKAALEKIAEQLGNKWTMTRKAYVMPEFTDRYFTLA